MTFESHVISRCTLCPRNQREQNGRNGSLYEPETVHIFQKIEIFKFLGVLGWYTFSCPHKVDKKLLKGNRITGIFETLHEPASLQNRCMYISKGRIFVSHRL